MVSGLAVELWGLPPLLALAALARWHRARGHGALDACLGAAVHWLAGVWLLSNGLGVFGALQTGPLRAVWSVIGLGAVVVLVRTRRVPWAWPRPRGLLEASVAAVAVALLALTLVRALAAPPNTVDVLNYHLPRQLMWLQQGGLEPFDTINDRENMMPPLAELAGLQFLALTGGDRWANLPQWAAYLGLGLGLVRLARVLGAGRRAAALAGLMGLLLPMAYHEASNAKNDLLATFVLVGLARQLALWRGGRTGPGRSEAVELGVTAAVAALIKSTALIYAPILGVVALSPWAWRAGIRRAALLGLVAVGTWALFCAPFFVRNQAWYGTPLGEHRAEDGGAQANEAMSPALLASNALRHATLHVLGPWESWNAAWLRFVRRAHDALGADLEDRRTTLWVLKFKPTYKPADETSAGAPVHFLLGLPLLLAVVFWPRAAPAGSGRWLAVAVLLGALAFCAAIKWQPWAARLQLPLFALGIVPGVLAVERGAAALRRAFAAASVLAALLAWWPGADTELRPLWTAPTLWTTTREADYYRIRPYLRGRDDEIVALARRAGWNSVYRHNIHDIAYPLMRRLTAELPGLRFAGAPAGALTNAPPDAIILLSVGNEQALYREFAGVSDWRLVGRGGGDGVYLHEAAVAELGLAEVVPAFGGWERTHGLILGPEILHEGSPLTLRQLKEGEARLGYYSRGRRLRLRAGVFRSAGDSEPLALQVETERGRVAVPLEPGNVWQYFEVDLPAAAGPHVVVLRAPGPDKLRFVRLQVVDDPAVVQGAGAPSK